MVWKSKPCSRAVSFQSSRSATGMRCIGRSGSPRISRWPSRRTGRPTRTRRARPCRPWWRGARPPTWRRWSCRCSAPDVPVVGGAEILGVVGRAVQRLGGRAAAPAQHAAHHVAHHQRHEDGAAALGPVRRHLALLRPEIGLAGGLVGVLRRHRRVLVGGDLVLLLALGTAGAGRVDALLHALVDAGVHLWLLARAEHQRSASHHHQRDRP